MDRQAVPEAGGPVVAGTSVNPGGNSPLGQLSERIRLALHLAVQRVFRIIE
jgi:hypothetical protein